MVVQFWALNCGVTFHHGSCPKDGDFNDSWPASRIRLGRDLKLRLRNFSNVFSFFTATFERKANICLGTRKLNALYFEIRQRDPSVDDENQSFEALRGCGLWVYSVFAQILFDCLPTAKGQRVVCRATVKVREDLMRTKLDGTQKKSCRTDGNWFFFTARLLCHHSRDCGRDDWSVHRRVVLSSLIDRRECVYFWPGIYRLVGCLHATFCLCYERSSPRRLVTSWFWQDLNLWIINALSNTNHQFV